MRNAIVVLWLIGLPSSLAAQAGWTLSGEVGSNRFSRAAHDSSSPAVSIGAWPATSYTVRLVRSGARSDVAVSVGYTATPFAAWIDNVAVVQGGELALVEFGLTYGRRLLRSGRGAALGLEAGPVLHVWTMSGEDPRTRLGALLGTVVELPLTDRWRVDLRADLTLTKSWLRPEDEVDGITREPLMRRGRLVLGITRRL